MRNGWERASADIALSDADLATLLRPAFPGARIIQAEKAEGGLANVTYTVRLAGRPTPVGVRLYVRAPATAAREQALCRLVAPRVPVPPLRWAAPENPVTGHPYAVVDWLSGAPLARVLPGLAEPAAAAVGRAVGAALAGIASFTFPVTGFLAEDLRVSDPLDVGGAGYRQVVGALTDDPLVRQRLGAGTAVRLWTFAEHESAVMDGLRELPPCLVHADFDATNILIERVGDAFRVSGVLDWERAYSGSVVADIGHALRPPGGTTPGFAAGLIAGFTGAGGRLPRDWRRAARASDLLAWLDLARRPSAGAELLQSVRQVVEATLAGRSPPRE